jgi:uncharacterized membrane protein
VELELLGLAGLTAFLIGGAAVMLVSSFRRTIELRAALLQALSRIERMEATITQLKQGRPQIQQDAPPEQVTAQLPAQLPAPPSLLEAPQSRPAPAPPEHGLVSQPAPAPTQPSAEPASPAAAIQPPHLGIIAFFVALAAFTALAAAKVGALAAPAGIGLAALAGLISVGAAEWRRSADLERMRPLTTMLPNHGALAALLGCAVMTLSVWYGALALNALEPTPAFIAAAAISLAAAALAERHGPWLIVCALICGAAAPALAALDSGGALARYVFLVLLCAAIMVQARRRDAPVWTALVSIIAIAWGAIAMFSPGADAGADHALTLCLYLAALAALALAYAWADGAGAMPFPAFWRAPNANQQSWTEPLLAGHGLAAAAGLGLMLVILVQAPPPQAAGPGLVAFAAFAIAAGVFRAGLWLAPAGAAALAASALVLWPATSGLPDAPGIITLAAAFGFMFAIGGALMLARAPDPRPGATLAALAPILILAAAHARVAAFAPPLLWAGAAAAIAALNLIAYVQFARSRPAAASAFAAGAALAAAACLYVLTPRAFAPLVLGACLPALALAARFRDEAGLRLGAQILCVLILLRLITPQLFAATASSAPNIALVFLPAAAMALLAALVFETPAAKSGARAAQASFALSVVLFAAMATLIARHLATAGTIGAPYANLNEMGLNTLAWLGLAALLAWRFGPRPRLSLFVLEFAAFAGAATHALVAGGALINPWWGLTPAPAPDWNGLSSILFAFGAPALLFLFYAVLRQNQKLEARAIAAASIGLVLLFLTLNLELRRLFHGADMAHAAIMQAEAWAYSLAWLGFAALLLALSTLRREHALLLASLALALVALAKTALFDLGGLDTAARLSATLLLVAAGAGLVWVYRRANLPRGATRPKTMSRTDPNLAPPR